MTEDTQHGAIPSHNNTSRTATSETLLVTADDSSTEELLLPVTTDNTKPKMRNSDTGEDIQSNKDGDKKDVDDNGDEADNSNDDSTNYDNNQPATAKTGNVTTSSTYDTEDSNGNKGKLNIKFVGWQKYRCVRKYTCTCGSTFSSQKKINTHYMEEHGMLRCTMCGKPFRTPAAHQKHQYEHLPKQFKCKKCGKEYMFQSQLDSHKISHRDQATFKCMHKKCDKWFKNKGDLTRHVKKHDSKTLYCKFCDYTASAIENLNGHMMKHNKLKCYVCLYCGSDTTKSVQSTRLIDLVSSLCH